MSADKSHYEAVLADLEAERARLDQAIGVLRRQLGKEAPLPPTGGDGGGPTDLGSRPSTGVGLPRNAFSGMKLPDAIKAFLKAVNQRQTPKQIHDGILAGGFHTTAKKLYANVYTTLLRLEQQHEAVKVQNEWGLAEWYPQAARRSSARVDKAVDKLVNGERTTDETLDDLAAEKSA